MKLRTSFFNFRVLIKNLSRFAPLWVLCAVGEVLGLFSVNVEKEAYWIVQDLSQIMGPLAIFHAVYALIVAACLFGDLFDSRMCNGLHAMPMRREGWLLTNLASGLVFALIPAIVGGGFAAVVLREYWWVALVWQATSLLQFLFFFGLAVFSAMCAGKRLGMFAIYGIINFLSMLIYWAATLIYEPLLPGVKLSDGWFTLFCPMISMVGDTYFDIHIFYGEAITKAVFEGYIPSAWWYLFICAAIGVVFALLAWLLYRKRHLETAGDFISFRPMRIFFLVAYTFAMGAMVYSFMGFFWGRDVGYGFLAAGILIGWFTGWMLLERTVKIFTPKVLIGFTAFAALFAGSIGLTILDPMGIVTYVPENEQIEKACIYLQADEFNYERDEAWGGWYITDPAEIAQVQQLHSQMIAEPKDPDTEVIGVRVRYQLKNGVNIYRAYDVPAESKTADNLELFLSDPRSTFATGDWERVKDTVEYVRIFFLGIDDVVDLNDQAQMQALLAAMEADCEAGLFAQHDYFHTAQEYVAGIDVTWNIIWDEGRGSGTRGGHVMVYEDCVNTVAFLENLY